MKKVILVVLVLLVAMVNIASAEWRERNQDRFEHDYGSSEACSVITGGYLFQPPLSKVVVVQNTPPQVVTAEVTVTRTYKQEFREGGCPAPEQTRSVGWKKESETTHTVEKKKIPGRSDVKYANSHMGQAPIVPICGLLGDMAKAAAFPVGASLIRPAQTNVSQSGGGASATATGGAGGAGGSAASSSSSSADAAAAAAAGGGHGCGH
ncbi:MAG: hypothetical protein PHF35_02120 [Candidatus Moranbacteria bacterium]|nr:hypothetical protein [Candidatus Moranbacteria bacterium]